MKNTIFTLLIATLIIASCTKDKKENPEPQIGGTISFSGATYEIKTGLEQYYGLRDGKHFTDIYLYSKEINVLFQNGNLSLNGKGAVLALELRKAEPGIAGVYTLGNNVVMKVQLLLNETFPKDGPPAALEFTSGTVTLSKSGENYRFTFDIRSSFDFPLTGSFYGPLLYFDYSN
jgi:hypothetical protein